MRPLSSPIFLLTARLCAYVFLFALVFVLASCGLDVIGEVSPVDDASVSSSSSSSGGSNNLDASSIGDAAVVGDGTIAPPPTQPDGASCDCPTAPPVGWTRVGFASTRSPMCPAGYDPINIVESPSAGGAACSCAAGSCAMSNTPSCLVGSIPCFVDNGGQCNQSGLPTGNVPAGGCDDYGSTVSVSPHLRLVPPAPTGATCATTPLADKTKVTTALERLCKPSIAACETTLCSAPSGGSEVVECVSQAGDVPCPGAPYVQRHLVGTDVDVACTNTCGCTTSGGKCAGTLTLFTNSSCTTGPLELIADDTCHPTSASMGYRYYKYNASLVPNTMTCTPNGTSTGTASLLGTQTVCCK